jgi:hypothetical protein
MIRQARLPIYMNYSEIGYTNKLDWTTVTVGAPSMLVGDGHKGPLMIGRKPSFCKITKLKQTHKL